MSAESVMLSTISSCFPFLLLPSIFPSIRVFSNELGLCIKWQKYWSFSLSISLSNIQEYSGLVIIINHSLSQTLVMLLLFSWFVLYFPNLKKNCYFEIVSKKLWEFTYIFHVESLNDNILLNLLYYSFSYINERKNYICINFLNFYLHVYAKRIIKQIQ